MPQWVPVTKERHGGVRFRRSESYAHAMKSNLAPVVFAELAPLVAHYPLVFVRRDDQSFGLFALLGLEPQRNLFVDAGTGRWRAGYIPAVLRAYPFRLLPGSQGDQWVLCVDEDSGTLHDGLEGLPLFTETGDPAPWVGETMNFLRQLLAQEQRTLAACAVLDTNGLMTPWDLTLRIPQGDRKVEGLYRVNESALHELDGEALRRLRDAGALALAYAQLFSAWHIHTLGRLLGEGAPRGEDGPPVTPSGELDLSFLVS